MKNTGKVTKLKLQVDQVHSFLLLGLVSSEPDYKLSLSLNNKLGISLRNISPVQIDGDSGSEQLFSRFSDTRLSPEAVFSLVSNRSGKNFLIRKLRNVDYLFHVYDPDNEINIKQISSSLKEITAITAVFSIDTESINDKNLQFVIQ
jgi:hypothetical protein